VGLAGVIRRQMRGLAGKRDSIHILVFNHVHSIQEWRMIIHAIFIANQLDEAYINPHDMSSIFMRRISQVLLERN
jgi:hypothetical protein